MTNTTITAETITTAQIRALRSDADAAGDYAQVDLCDLATATHKPAGIGGNAPRALVMSGLPALDYAARNACRPIALHKYADPIEGARDGLTLAEAREIAKEDPGLIWLSDDVTDEDRAAAREACAEAICTQEQA